MALDSRCLLLLLGLLPLSPDALAAENAPDLELLEFLGSWEDTDGEWVDPLRMLEEWQAEDHETAPETAQKETPVRVKNTEVEKDD